VQFKRELPKMSLAWRFSVIGLVVVVFAAAFVIGQTLRSSSPRPVVADGYNCIPGSLIPQLKPGASGTMTTKYGGFAARFRSSIPAPAPANGLNVGMPFGGTLTMSGDGKSWVLPRPDNPNVSQNLLRDDHCTGQIYPSLRRPSFDCCVSVTF